MFIQQKCADFTLLIGRILLAFIFFKGGYSLITGSVPIEFAATQGIPELVTWIGFVIKFLAGMAVIAGYHTQLAALALIIFTTLTAFIFHGDFGNVFWKEISMIGGLLILAVSGAGGYSLDAWLSENGNAD